MISWIWIPVIACGSFMMGALTVILWAALSSPLTRESIIKAFTDNIRFPTE